MATTIERDVIKKALRELVREEPEFLRQLLVDFMTEEQQRIAPDPAEDADFVTSLQDVFAKYGDTLKKLA